MSHQINRYLGNNRKIIFLIMLITVPSIFAKKILFINTWSNIVASGLTNTILAQSKKFIEKGWQVIILGCNETHMQKVAQTIGLIYETISDKTMQQFYEDIFRVCKKYDIQFVITPNWHHIPTLKKIAHELPIKIIFNRHATLKEDNFHTKVTLIKGIDGFISQRNVNEFIIHANYEKKLDIKKIVEIAPFWNEEKYLNFRTNETRHEYFHRRYKIDINDHPIICTIANFAHPCKNYPLLIKAMHKLIHQKKIIVHLMIAGDGYLRSLIEASVRNFNIEKYIHFLGSIEDTQALLYHSDIHVLPSYFESFGIVNLEAACMKKPIIVAEHTGSSNLILDGKMGLLFKNKDVNDLTKKIEYLLNNTLERKKLGDNGFQYVRCIYNNEVIYNKWEKFLNDILENK